MLLVHCPLKMDGKAAIEHNGCWPKPCGVAVDVDKGLSGPLSLCVFEMQQDLDSVCFS